MGTRTITIDFEGDLDAFAKQLQIDYATVLKRVAIDLFGRIVMKTPVDTGRARASWTIEIGKIDSTVAPEGQQPAMNTWIAEAKAGAALATLTERAVFSEPIWIANSLPYINALENGHSRQAPAGMVKLSMEEVMLKMNLLTKGL
jgi:hypothetical protein